MRVSNAIENMMLLVLDLDSIPSTARRDRADQRALKPGPRGSIRHAAQKRSGPIAPASNGLTKKERHERSCSRCARNEGGMINKVRRTASFGFDVRRANSQSGEEAVPSLTTAEH
jgi:hypothetical protein